MDQQRFHGIADARTLHFGVKRNFLSHGKIGQIVDIHMADAFAVAEHLGTVAFFIMWLIISSEPRAITKSSKWFMRISSMTYFPDWCLRAVERHPPARPKLSALW